MTKQDYISELEKARDLAISAQTDFFRGEATALDYAIELAAHIRPYSVRKTAKTIEIRLTDEQAKHLDGLLGNGPLDRLIRSKLTRARNARDE